MDGINVECWKYGRILLHHRPLHLFNMCWKQGKISRNWLKAKMIPLFKKGDREKCGNNRGISLLDSVYKIYCRILNNWLKTTADHIIDEKQIGFREKLVNSRCHIYSETVDWETKGISCTWKCTFPLLILKRHLKHR